jgi:hypothetical protein
MEYIAGVITLRAIFSLHWRAYCCWYEGVIRESVIENVQKILKCRTFQLGYHLYQCPKCHEMRMIPHSCKSRFCSCCGKVAADKWTNERLSDILPVGYHHLMFSLPWQLRAICILNRGIMFQLLFCAVSVSIQSWAKEYGGYIPGFYVVLHSFGSDVKFNPHFHVLMTAGGLSLDHKRWVNAPDNFLMPAKGLKRRWRHNVIKGIIKANNKNLLEMPFLAKKGKYLNLRGVISVISKLSWYVNIGARLLEIGLSVKYIGRYTKRPVIAEARIISCDHRWVIFKFKDYAQGGKTSIKKMGVFTFITYLTQHIPDKYFRVVRGYGLFSNRLKGELLPRARMSPGKPGEKEESLKESWRERIHKFTGKDPLICENCSVEMLLIFVCYGPVENDLFSKLGINFSDKIPSKQFKLIPDTS